MIFLKVDQLFHDLEVQHITAGMEYVYSPKGGGSPRELGVEAGGIGVTGDQSGSGTICRNDPQGALRKWFLPPSLPARE